MKKFTHTEAPVNTNEKRPRIDQVKIKYIYDDHQPDYLNHERTIAIDNGAFWMIGIQVEAEVSYDRGQGNRRIEWFTSGGLWGIESDSGKDYLKKVEAEELDDLKSHLEKFNVDTSVWADKTPTPEGLIGEMEHY